MGGRMGGMPAGMSNMPSTTKSMNKMMNDNMNSGGKGFKAPKGTPKSGAGGSNMGGRKRK